MKEFNSGIDQSFAIYLNAAAKHYKEEEKAELPLSGMSYNLGKSLGPAYDMLSPFACLSGKDNSHVGKGEIQVKKSPNNMMFFSLDCFLHTHFSHR